MHLRSFTRSAQLFLLALIGMFGGQQAVAAVAVDDVYTAGEIPTYNDVECGTGHILVPSPIENDQVTSQANVDVSAFLNSLNPVTSGQGFMLTIDNDGDQVADTAVYFPSCGSQNDGSFTDPAVFDYDLIDNGDPNNPDVGQITVNPASQQPAATTQPDVYDAGSVSDVFSSPGPGTGETTYALLVSPLANDTLNTPYDETATINATDNFTVVSGGGRFQAFFGNNGIEFQHIRSQEFIDPVVVSYDLRDVQGASIPNTATTITINPPPISSQDADAVDDVYSANNLQQTTVNGSQAYILAPDPLSNDTFLILDTSQTLVDTNFILSSGSGSITVTTDANQNSVFTFIPGPTFDVPAVFTYTLYDATPDVAVASVNSASIANQKPSQDTATITINPATTIRLSKQDNINDACDLENGGQIQFCNLYNPAEQVELLSTITAQADSLFGLQSGQIANIRNRMTQNRSAYSALSLSGLNASVLGKHVPVGRIAQAMVNQPSGGGAADDDIGGDTLGFFIAGNFVAGDKDDSDLNVGYDADGYNLTSGLDFRINDHFIIGGALGIAEEEADFNYDFGDQDIAVQSLALYSNYYTDSAFYIDTLLMLTQGDIETSRNLILLSEVADGSTDGSLWSIAATSGYSWNTSSWQVDLFGRFEFTNLQIDAYTEQGSTADLTVEDQDVDSLELAFGGRFAKAFSLSSSVIVPSLDIEILKQFEGDTRFIGVNMEQLQTGFGVEDEADDTSYANIGFSISSVFAGGFSAYFRAESLVADELRGRVTYGGGLRWEF